MNFNLMVHEILQEFDKAPKRKDKIDVLRKYGNKNFQLLMQYAFDPKIVFDVEIPEYRVSKEPAGLNYMYLHQEVNRLYNFIVGHPKRAASLTKEKQSSLLAVILESLYKEEAEILISIIKKELTVPYLTARIVKEAWPEMDM